MILQVILLILLLFGCSESDQQNEETNDVSPAASADQLIITEQTMEDEEEYSGIRVSEWYRNEEFNRDVIDILNFDDRERIIKGDTICFDTNQEILPSNDSETLTIPPKSQWTWIPVCPEGTTSFTINITELN